MGKWRIYCTERFIKKVRRLGLSDRVKRFLSSLEAISLLREEVVEYVDRRPAKRIRMGDWRLFFLVDCSKKLIIFYDIRHRRRAYG